MDRTLTFNPDMQVSALGGTVSFAQFLTVSRLFDGWVGDAPLSAKGGLPDDAVQECWAGGDGFAQFI
jgi:hypothetical protein